MSSASLLDNQRGAEDSFFPSNALVIATADPTVPGSVSVRTLSWFDSYVPFRDLRRVAMDNDVIVVCVLDLDTLRTHILPIDRAGFGSIDDIVSWSPKAVIRQAVDEIRHHGYFSRKDADTFNADPTADRVDHAMKSRLPPIPHDAEEESHVSAVLSMIDGFDTAKSFNERVKEAVANSTFDSRDLGHVVSVVGRYFQDLLQDDITPVGSWIGSVGHLVDVELVVVAEPEVHTNTGIQFPTKLRGVDGAKVTLWNRKPTGLVQGDIVRLKGIVAKCGVWRGRKETTVKDFVYDVISHANPSTIQNLLDDDSSYY